MINTLNIDALIKRLSEGPLESWFINLPEAIGAKLEKGHGDLARWQTALQALPDITANNIYLKDVFCLDASIDPQIQQTLKSALLQLSPWRKGPFEIFGVHIDTEWRSDWKWERVSKHVDLKNKVVLDVGCGNGYYAWRMLGAGAHTVIGIDPNWLFLCQFMSMKKYLPDLPVWSLPLTLEELPTSLNGFDTVFSMGVLYHRRSPIDHLLALKDCLRPSGELVLETLVVEGDEHTVLVPEDRYAQMRNVWFLPSPAALELWLRRAGFKNIRLADISKTSVQEQRSTEWMKFQSLPAFLDPTDANLTVEGLPAPLRATFIAEKP
jgi:tRNA (mo5U34)-methyltransferase